MLSVALLYHGLRMLMNSVQQVHRQVSFPSRQEKLVCDSLPSFEGQLMTSPNYLYTNTLEIKFCVSYILGNSHVVKQKSLFFGSVVFFFLLC